MRRKRRRPLGFKNYLLIVLACGAAAVALHLLFAGSEQVERYADEHLEKAVREAVRAEAKEAVKEDR